MNLGENIYRLRTAKNMSQGDLADALEVSRQSVSKWENNSAVPELDKLVKMAELFGVTLDELVTGQASIRREEPASHPLTARTLIGCIMIGIGTLAVLLLIILGPASLDALYICTPFFLVGLILLTHLSKRGICMLVMIYLLSYLTAYLFPSAVLLLTSGGIGVGYAAARLWDEHMEDSEDAP